MINRIDTNSKWKEMKLPCEHCGSSDGYHISENELGEYGHCFSCEVHERLDKNMNKQVKETEGCTMQDSSEILNKIEKLRSIELIDRKIKESVTNKYGVKSFVIQGKEAARYYPITKDSKLVAYKKRLLPKEFSITGNTRGEIDLFGQSNFPNGGKLLIVCVGEEDALASFQMTSEASKTGNGYASVSLPKGSKDIKSIKGNIEWLEKFETIIFAVDQEEDKDLLEAEKWCELLTLGKCKIARFSENDVSDMLKSGKQKEFMDSLRNANTYVSRDTTFSGNSFDMIIKEDEIVDAIGYPPVFGIDNLLCGMVKSRTDLFVSFPKSGKSTVVLHMIHKLIKGKEKVAMFSTETEPKSVLKKLLQIDIKKDLTYTAGCDIMEYNETYKSLFGGELDDSTLIINRCTELSTPELLINKFRQYILGCDCKYVFVDNLTRLLRKFGHKGNANSISGELIGEMVDIARNYGVYLCLVAHVRKKAAGSQEKAHEAGGRMGLDDIYGSGDLAKEVSNVISVTRDNSKQPNLSMLQVIASRDNKVGNGNKFTYDFDKATFRTITKEETEDNGMYETNDKTNNIF